MNGYIEMRADALRKEMRQLGSDAFVIFNDEDSNWESLFYMSGFRGTAGALAVYADEEPELFLDGRYFEQGKKQSPYKVTEQNGGAAEALVESLKKHGACEILCEAEKTSHANWLRLSSETGRWRDGTDIARRLRRKKDAGETDDIKKAAAIGSKAFIEALDCVKPGMTEKEFETLLNYKICTEGGEPGFDMIVASGPRSALPHGRATGREMIAGEWVTVDFGARWNGYFCDITRNFFIGRASGWAKDLHSLIEDAHKAGAAALKAGTSGGGAHAAAAAVFEAAGKEKYFTHSLGHSFGLEIHEPPVLSPRREDILQEGDVVTIEPGLYIPGTGGMRIEDDYLVLQNGAVRLTSDLPQLLYTV